jgi:3-oxo-5-alpha-steroid 4-dehydrogenase 1
MGTTLLVVVHLVITAMLLAYIADVAMPFYAYRSDDAVLERAAPVSASMQPIAWSQRPLFLVRGREEHAMQLSQHLVHHDALIATEYNSAVVLRSSIFQLLLSAFTYVVLTRVVPAPYGRHTQRLRFPVTLPSRVSWVLQESPTLFNVLYFVALEFPRAMGHGPFAGWFDGGAGPSLHAAPPSADQQRHHTYGHCSSYWDCVWVACTQQHLGLLLFVIHYVHRSWLYPWSISASAHRVPVLVTWAATVYCTFNGRLQVLASANAAAAAAASSAAAAKGPVPALQPPSTQVLRCWLGKDCPRYTRASPFSLDSFVWTAVMAVYVAALFAGSVLFFYGQRTNMRADYYLVSLRGSRNQLLTEEVDQGKQHQQHAKELSPMTESTSFAENNRDHDRSKGGYRIPVGGWFDYVSCPNFFGELMEWTGYVLVVAATTAGADCGAVAATHASAQSAGASSHGQGCLQLPLWVWSSYVASSPVVSILASFATPYTLAAMSFLLYVWCNLAPRAVEHHHWYLETFGTAYDALQRHALIPGVY